MSLIENDFLDVITALSDYRNSTGMKNVMIGGWDIEDKGIYPPDRLLRYIEEIPKDVCNYSYISSCYKAKETTSRFLGNSVKLDNNRLSSDTVSVVPSGSVGLHLALTALRDHGVRKAFISSPNFFATIQICKHLGLAIEILQTKNFLSCSLDFERIKDSMKQPNCVFILTNPAYCMGIEYDSQDLDKLFSVIPDYNYILIDEVFLGLNWNHELPWYTYNYPQNTIVLRSPSKIFFMYGLKVALLMAPKHIINYIEVLTDFLTTGLPGNFENTAIAYIQALNDWENEFLNNENGEFLQWRAMIVDRLLGNLEQILTITNQYKLKYSLVESGPYATIAIDKDRVLEQFNAVHLARETGALIMTSNYYFHTDTKYVGFRVNLCGNSIEISHSLNNILRKYVSNISLP